MAGKTNVVMIRAEPGREPGFHLIDPAGIVPIPDPAVSLPQFVLEYGAWLSALADQRPLPPGKPPPVVIAPARPGEAFIAMVSFEPDAAN
ncbi:hypothetical protein [Falsiroseomonas sp.]|uniref:hypothetical protein n=1 Tax=Falsiroseomonas sp. TaxID=2870721 RepID=UPI003561A884